MTAAHMREEALRDYDRAAAEQYKHPSQRSTDGNLICEPDLDDAAMIDADSDERRLHTYLREKAAAGQLRVTIRGGRVLLHCPGDGLTVVAAEFPGEHIGLVVANSSGLSQPHEARS